MTLTNLATRRRPLRTILARFVRARLDEGEHEIRTQQMITLATERFENDEEFAAAAVRDVIQQLVPEILSAEFTSRRSEYVTTAVGAVSHQRLEETVADRLGKVFENALGRYVIFNDMTRGDLLAAAESREKRAAGELRWANFERDVAARLPNDKVTVGEALEPAVLADLLKRHFPSQP